MFAKVVAPEFFRREPRLRAEAYLLGLVAGLEQANGWTIPEFAGDRSPLGMQAAEPGRLGSGRGQGPAGPARGRRSRRPGRGPGRGRDGFLMTGRLSAGVQRQYTGTAGKITNCQVGVFLAYAVPSAGVRVLVDRDLHVPQSWTADRDRCGEADIGQDVAFVTKPQLARAMVERVRELGLPFAWRRLFSRAIDKTAGCHIKLCHVAQKPIAVIRNER
jgi:hypothetical protein